MLNVLSELFDLREEVCEEEIKHLTEKLEQFKTVLAERKNKKKETVDCRWNELSS
ncbi:MAG: hypothetical protein ACFFDN_20370 [Candidatus Hodarchaeota archaeon]